MRYPPSAILSRKGIARYGGVSRTGPLSLCLFQHPFWIEKNLAWNSPGDQEGDDCWSWCLATCVGRPDHKSDASQFLDHYLWGRGLVLCHCPAAAAKDHTMNCFVH